MSKNSPKTKRPYLVGLTGGIGAGKSLVARFWQLLGVPVFNADLQARHILENSSDVRVKIQSLLGKDSYINSMPDRPFIALAVFGNSDKLDALNSIVHPAVGEVFEKWVLGHSNSPYLLKEAAIISEMGHAASYDAVVLVQSPKALRMERLQMHRSMKPDEIQKRMDAQWTDEEKAPESDFIIENDERHSIIKQVLALHKELLSKNER